MKSIKKCGFLSQYYLTEDGLIFNKKTKQYKKPYNNRYFKLKSTDGEIKTIYLKSLYKMVYGKVFCIDNIPSLQNEVWKPINGTQEYFISNYSRIISYKGYEAILLKPWLNKKENGYYVVKLTINGKSKNYAIHRLVANAFIKKPNQKEENLQVHHMALEIQKNRQILKEVFI